MLDPRLILGVVLPFLIYTAGVLVWAVVKIKNQEKRERIILEYEAKRREAE